MLINDLLIRAVFTIKQRFYNKVGLADFRGKTNNDKLQRMITVGTGALCLFDLSEAAITSWGNWVVFFSHLNISAWNRLAMQGIKELHSLSDRGLSGYGGQLSAFQRKDAVQEDRGDLAGDPPCR